MAASELSERYHKRMITDLREAGVGFVFVAAVIEAVSVYMLLAWQFVPYAICNAVVWCVGSAACVVFVGRRQPANPLYAGSRLKGGWTRHATGYPGALLETLLRYRSWRLLALAALPSMVLGPVAAVLVGQPMSLSLLVQCTSGDGGLYAIPVVCLFAFVNTLPWLQSVEWLHAAARLRGMRREY